MGKIKFVQPIEPPSPQPSPAGRERGVGCRARHKFLSDYCHSHIHEDKVTVEIYFSATEILRTIQTNLIPKMDSHLRGNDGGEVFGVV